jgi:hypothetical protein
MTEWILIMVVLGCAECETYRIPGFPSQAACDHSAGTMNADPRLKAGCIPDGDDLLRPAGEPEPKAPAPKAVAPPPPRAYQPPPPRPRKIYRSWKSWPSEADSTWPRMR